MKRMSIITRIARASVLLFGAIVLFAGIEVMPANAVSSSDWRPGRIIDDAIFYNKSSMNVNQIQQFLNSKVPTCDSWGTKPYGGTTRAAYSQQHGVTLPLICLKDYQENTSNHQNNLNGNPVPAGAISAAQIIYNAAQSYGINPQVLIVLVQKEQGLVTDDWPWPVQYRSATGYGCPDSAACDANYYGFYNQVTDAAWQFRHYADSPNAFNFVPNQNNFIRWSPDASCGGSTVFIQNQATASLYNYTPYQPNQAAINNLYGSGDSCSAYGNRNFWTYFNDWFGLSLGDGFARVKSDDPNDPRQWVIYGTIKQYIPDPQTLYAWGLQNQQLITMSSSTLNAISVGPNLDRLMRVNTGNDSSIYFLDSGKRYRIPWDSIFDAWNLRNVTVSNVSRGLFNVPTDGGELATFSVKDPNSSSVYMVDGHDVDGRTVLRPYASDTVRFAIEGTNAPYMSVSNDYWSRISTDIGGTLTAPKFTVNGTTFEVMNRFKFSLPASSLYPGSAQPVSLATFSRLPYASPLYHLVRSISSSTVYLIDGGQRHQIDTQNVLRSWSLPNLGIQVMNDDFVNSIPLGTAINGYFADVGGQLYLVDGAKQMVANNSATAFRNAGPVFSASSDLMSLFNTAPIPLTGYIKGRSSPAIYMLDNSGKKRYMDGVQLLAAWGGYRDGVSVLSDYVVDSIQVAAPNPNFFVTDGTTNYVLDDGKKMPVDSSVQAAWGLSNPQGFTDGTLDRLTTTSALSTKIRDATGHYRIAMGGSNFETSDPNIAEVWSLQNSQVVSAQFTSNLATPYTLSRFVKSNVSGDSRYFVICDGSWYAVSPEQFNNLGGPSAPLMSLNPSLATNAITDWNKFVVKSPDGTYYVIDGGGKRYITNWTIANQWTGNGSIAVPTVSYGFLGLLPTRGYIERAIKGSGPNIYLADQGTKRLLSPNTYPMYAPYMSVTDTLINALPNGSPL